LWKSLRKQAHRAVPPCSVAADAVEVEGLSKESTFFPLFTFFLLSTRLHLRNFTNESHVLNFHTSITPIIYLGSSASDQIFSVLLYYLYSKTTYGGSDNGFPLVPRPFNSETDSPRFLSIPFDFVVMFSLNPHRNWIFSERALN